MDTTVTVEVVSMEQQERELLTAALRKWAEHHSINPADFARVTGYSYNHAFQVLRGKLQASSETIGKILLTYGVGSATEIWGIMDLMSHKVLLDHASIAMTAEHVASQTPINPHVSPED